MRRVRTWIPVSPRAIFTGAKLSEPYSLKLVLWLRAEMRQV
jgi:hypothetical protein